MIEMIEMTVKHNTLITTPSVSKKADQFLETYFLRSINFLLTFHLLKYVA